MDTWFEKHGFPYIKTEDGTYYWQTNVATGEYTAEKKYIWHEREYFDIVKKEEEENQLYLSMRKMRELEKGREEK